MTQVINNFEYRTTVGSDVDRDGFFAELTRTSNGQIELVAEAFFNDSISEFTFTAFVKEIPFDVIEKFVEEAKRRLPPVKSN
jgi:hypothetical protein